MTDSQDRAINGYDAFSGSRIEKKLTGLAGSKGDQMAGSLNRATLIGNVGKDPEIRRTQSGNSIANFSIATSETWRDRSTGEKKEKTEWHRISVFSEGLVKVIESYVKKGSKVMVEGQIQTRKWQKDGVDHYSTEIVLQGFGSSLILLDNRGSSSDRGDSGRSSQSQDSGTGYRGGTAGHNDMDDDIPFSPEFR